MHPFCILMLCFSGALLLYAGILFITRDPDMIPRMDRVSTKDAQAYARAFAKMMAVVALAPLSSAIYGLFNVVLGLIMLFVSFAICIWIGTFFFKNLP